MACNACDHDDPGGPRGPAGADLARYRRILWAALLANLAMFGVEVAAGWQAGSMSLLADAIDFAGDAMNYGVSLAVLAAALPLRARAAFVKGLAMVGFGVFVLGSALWAVWHGRVPHAMTMGVVAVIAFGVNVAVAWALFAFREGDANMRSVWLCSRNDALGNAAVLAAALGVGGTGSAWPDLAVAAGMAALALQGGFSVLRQARAELRAAASPAPGPVARER